MKRIIILLTTIFFITSCDESKKPRRVRDLSYHAIIVLQLDTTYKTGDTIATYMSRTGEVISKGVIVE